MLQQRDVNNGFPAFPDQVEISKGDKKAILCRPVRPDNIDDLYHVQLKETDTLLITYPRSGTTLTQRLMYAMTFSEEKRRLDSDFNNSFMAFPFLEYNDGERNGLKWFRNNIDQPFRFLKTHLPVWMLPENIPCKKVFVTRDMKDMFISMYHFLRNNPRNPTHIREMELETYFNMFSTGECQYGDWFEWHRDWLDSKLENSIWITYEELIGAFEETMNRLAKFLDVRMTDELMTVLKDVGDFQKMKETVTYPVKDFIRKGIVGDHKNFLSEEQIQTFDRKMKEVLPELI